MAESTHEDSSTRLFGILFTIIAVVALVGLIYMLSVRSSADDSAQSTTVSNANPTVDTVLTAIASGGADQANVNPVENSTRTLYIRGQATDNNGCNDLDTAANWNLDVYRTNVASGSACTTDNNDCYKDVTTSNLTFTGCTGAGDLNIDYEWTAALQYYADGTDAAAVNAATTWTAGVTAGDEAAGVSSVVTDTFEYNSLIAFDITATVPYGTLALGADSAQKTVTFTQTGNRDLDADQTASGDMICNGSGSQNIPVANARLSLTNGFTYGTGDAALGAGPLNFNLTLGRRTNDGAALTKDSYLILRVPATGLRGTCSNTLTFTAKADV